MSTSYNRGALPSLVLRLVEVDAIQKWLGRYAVGATHSAYRLEATRLAIWCHLSGIRSLSDISDDEWTKFLAFLKSPPPYLIGQCKAPYGDPEWRPFFRSGLRISAFRTSLRILSSLYKYLCAERILSRNPALVSVKNEKWDAAPRPKVPALNQEELDAIESYVTALSDQEDGPRLRWLIQLLCAGFRVSEMTDSRNTMGQFYVAAQEGRAMVVYSEHLGARMISTGEQKLICCLLGYRVALGLTEPPDVDDDTPLISSPDCDKPLTRQCIYALTKTLLIGVADKCQEGTRLSESVEHLRLASIESIRLGIAANIAEQKGVINARVFLGFKSLTNVPSLDQRIFDNQKAPMNHR